MSNRNDGVIAAAGNTLGSYRGAWAAGTTYAANDVVTLGGATLVCNTGHTAVQPFSLTNWTTLVTPPNVFNVRLYGAQGDNSTDDTAAVNAAVNAATAAGIADGSYYAEVNFPAGTYVLSSATTKGGAGQGNAQIPLPVVAATGRKFTLVLSGPRANRSTLAHWDQTVGQRAGAVLRSTLAGQTSDATWLAPAVIGGPTVAVNGSSTYTNLHVVIDGLAVMAPYNPSLLGFDFRYVAQATIVSAAALANAGPAGTPALSTLPTDTGGMALRMPQSGNNDCALVVDFACEGWYYGVSFGEHFDALRLACIYTQVGCYVSVGGGSFHGATIQNYSCEGTTTGIQSSGSSGGAFPLAIAQMSVESVTTDIDDPNGNFTGTVQWLNIANGTPTINGFANGKLVSLNQAARPGAKTAPSMPATTVALTNPFWRDAAVNITGGTVTVIKVDGTTTGLTSGTVLVPSGRTIAITYSVAPTWVWTLL